MLSENPGEQSPSSSNEAPAHIVVKCEHSALVDPKLLKPHPMNPNEHSDMQIEMFKHILVYQGWRRPITVSKRSGYITKGHGARLAALELGLKSVPVDYQDYDDEDQELADIVADNQLSRMSQMNNDKLQKIIDGFESPDFNFELTGFKIDEINTIMDGFSEDWTRQDVDLSIPEPSQPPEPKSYATETTPSGGPAAGEPYQVDVREPVDPKGSRELSKEEFSDFKHKCPKCQFEFN